MANSPTGPGWLSRVRGCLLLAACGDALGARFEGIARVASAEVDHHLAHLPDLLRWTDDTAMTLVLAEHLARRDGTVDEDELAGELAAEWARDPTRGYGPGAASVLARIEDGTPWQQAAGQLFGGAGSFGNGAAMRVSPVGLIPGLAASAVAGRARRSAVVTHTHPHGGDGAAVQAVAIVVATRSDPANPITTDAFVAQVAAHAQTTEFRTVLQRVSVLVRRGTTPTQVATEVGNDVSAVAPRYRPRWPRSCRIPTTRRRRSGSPSAPAATPTQSPPWPVRCAVPGAVTGMCPTRGAPGWKPPTGSPPWLTRWPRCRRARLTGPVPAGRVPWPDPDRTRADQTGDRRRVWCHGRPRADADR